MHWGDLIHVHKDLMGRNEKKGARFHSVVPSKMHRLKHEKLHFKIRKHFYHEGDWTVEQGAQKYVDLLL